MAVTRSTPAERARTSTAAVLPSRAKMRAPELLWLAIASVLVAAGLALVFFAKTTPQVSAPRPPLDLRRIDRREQLLPYLDLFANPHDRQ